MPAAYGDPTPGSSNYQHYGTGSILDHSQVFEANPHPTPILHNNLSASILHAPGMNYWPGLHIKLFSLNI